MVANRLVSPTSKRRVPEWAREDVAMPSWFGHPPLHRYYQAVDVVAEAKEATEEHLYARLTDLTNLDLSLVCYDLTSTFFEGSTQPSERFESKAFGYSRDHRGDRPQVVIGLLCTTDGIPIAHHVFAGNTSDVSTLPGVLTDLKERFSVGGICVVADRGLISTDNLDALSSGGFDHVLAIRLHRDAACEEALEASTKPDTSWVPVPGANSAAADVTLADGRRCVVVASFERHTRDVARTTELVARTETKLLALEDRVRQGRLKDPAKIGRAAQRILGPSGISRLFDVEIGEGSFLYHYNDDAFDYEQRLLCCWAAMCSPPASPRLRPAPRRCCWLTAHSEGTATRALTSYRRDTETENTEMSKLIILLSVLGLALAACGGGTDGGSPTGPIAVAEVPADGTDDPITVRGYLFVDPDGNALLCDLIAESYPPQCGGDRITVTGDLPLDDLTTDQGRSWSDSPIDLTGIWDGATLVVG
jgi:hypothetical protein